MNIKLSKIASLLSCDLKGPDTEICNLTIDSHCHTYIKGNWKVQVNGNKYETILGNNVITVHKNQSETCNVNFTQSVGGTKGTTETGSVTET